MITKIITIMMASMIVNSEYYVDHCDRIRQIRLVDGYAMLQLARLISLIHSGDYMNEVKVS